MVLFKVKISEEDQFLFRTTTNVSVKDTRRELTDIFNLRQRIRALGTECEDLGQYGIAKKPEEQGIDSYSETPVAKGQFYAMDPTGKRDGNACCPASRATLTQTITDALALLNKSLVEKKEEASKQQLLEAVDLIRGAVMICYPMGLPEWDPVRLLLEYKHHDCHSPGCETLEAEDMSLWFAGKEMQIGNLLKAHVGDRESTTAIVRLTKASHGAPAREPAIDEATYKGILSWSYKKQEEQKALAENQDDYYLDSAWASTKSLKQHLTGTTNIRI